MPVKTKQQDTRQTELKPTAILLPMPPDYSCEIEKPLRYVDYIADVIGEQKRVKDAREVTLSIEEVETFVWMLRDAGIVIRNMFEDFYGEDSWSNLWWENRKELESRGIEQPFWFQIENSRNERRGQLQ